MGLKYQVLAVDLDGTLVQKNNRISHRNVDAIRQFTQLGGTMVFVTGRSLDSTIFIANKIFRKTGYRVPYLCSLNGTLIYDNIHHQILHQSLIPRKTVEEIFRYAKHNKAVFGAYTERVMETNRMPIYGWGKFPAFISFFKNKKTIQLRNWNEKTPLDAAYKINFMFRFKAREDILALMRTKYQGLLEIVSPSRHLSEITNYNINKAYGITLIAQKLGVNLDQIVAVGDSANDIPMFKICGLSLGARKKHPVIRPYVNQIMPEPQKDAVAKAIFDYMIDK